MTRACHAAVRMATGDAFTDQEIDDFLDRVAERAQRAGKDAPDLSAREAIATAAAQLTKDEIREAMIAKRTQLYAKRARGPREAKLAAMPATMGEVERLRALLIGSEKQGLGTSSSVDAEGRARAMSLWGQVEIGLNKMAGLKDRLVNPFGLTERGFDRKVAAEMARLNGAGQVEPTGDEGALHAARVFTGALRAGKDAQNALGAWIDELPGYIARQTHDPLKVAGGYWREISQLVKGGARDWTSARLAAEKNAFGAWRDFITPRLDPKTFQGLDSREFTDEERAGAQGLQAAGILKDASDPRELMLHTVWQDIVTGRHAVLAGAEDDADFRANASLARVVSRARVLHFKDPDAWIDYNQAYGRSSLYSSIMGQLERAGRNAALMKTFGPNPDAAFKSEIDRLRGQARSRGDVGAQQALDKASVQQAMEAINGRADMPQNLRFAAAMRNLRAWEAMTKLGGIVLSKTTDLVLSGATTARAGAGYLNGMFGAIEGITRLGSAEAKAAAESMDVGARAFAGHLGGQFQPTDGARGWASWGTSLMYRINGFTFMNEGVRKGVAQGLARHFGEEAAKPLEAVNAGTRETLERFGITRQDWETARAGVQAAPDGTHYFGLDHLDGDEQLRLKFATMLHDLIDNSTGEARARERLIGTGSARPGTVLGEFLRSFMQLKGFVNTVVGRQLLPATRGYAGMSPVATTAYMIIGSAVAGYLAMSAKQIASGQLPRPPAGQSPMDTLKIWTAALAQGGGLGIYGDFLFGEQNRNGGDFSWSQLGGPLASDSEQVAKVVQQAMAGGEFSETTGRSPLPGELVRLASRNIPLVNLWYTRLALDYLVLWRLQEAVSPGYLQRYEDRVRDKEGRAFYLQPTSAAP